MMWRCFYASLASLFLCNALYVSAVSQADFAVYLSFCLAGLLASYSYFYPILAAKTGKISYCVRFLQLGFGLWLASFMLFSLLLQYIATTPSQMQPIQAILVFGGGIQDDQPSPSLKLRLDRAVASAQDFKNVPIIVSGGKPYKDANSEAEVMQTYLHQLRIPFNRIFLEARSTSTQTNLNYSTKTLEDLNLSKESHIAFISSDFHLPRITAIAKKQNYTSFILIAAKTPIDLRFNAYLREYFAYLSGLILREY
jgi:uncharacterized SAM-binding protein YcdF (DUF218 family)